MKKEHINTFLILAERARGAGLIRFEEMPAVLQAIEAAKSELNKADAPTLSDMPQEAKNEKHGKRDTVND